MEIKIVGTGSCLPAYVMINEELTKSVETSDEWIRTRTGIEKRYIAKEETTTSMAVDAAKKALNMAKLSGEDIDLIIVATLSGDYHTPSTACLVQAQIGAKHATCFDLNAACSGFVFSIETAAAYMQANMAKTALIIGAETLSKLVDWEDRTSCILFGDGAGAAIVTAKETKQDGEKDGTKVTNYAVVSHSDGESATSLTCEAELVQNPLEQAKRESQKIKMDGQAIFKFAVKNVPPCIEEVLEKGNVAKEDVDYFLLHQANERMLQTIAKKLKMPLDKFPRNVAQCGNTSSASIPILLDEINRKGMLTRGQKIVMCGFGGGLTWGAIYLEW